MAARREPADPRFPDPLPPDPRPLDPRHRAGRLGEALAASYLALSGYEIVAQNVRAGRYEIDIVARDGDATMWVMSFSLSDSATVAAIWCPKSESS